MQTLRQSLRNQRRTLSDHHREAFARQLLQKVQQVVNFQEGQKIALYLENDGEISPKHIQNFLEDNEFSIYLPILDDKSLKFARIGDKFKNNKFGIAEPTSTDILNAEQLDIIFMPLVGFDTQKNRLGMGGGFYDRTLAFKKHQEHNANPKIYGLAFDCQKVEKLNAKPWDAPLDVVITPTIIYK
ncbi:MAG: 5-formyltetrahydrofolate cyclo-ligase [Gammaproteobacteria bacterium]|nr:5-formyltetrahydrofolate cyclo-ligase [Gammaproteobacteria bacterium]